MFSRLITIVALVGSVLTMSATSSHALEFSFSIVNDIGLGSIDGEIMGRILGLVDDTAGQAATSVIIDRFPPVLVRSARHRPLAALATTS